ncbi:MAG: adenosylmethionine decarboxylase [Alphaproteobacteria bacterium]|nr:adenosylmethionine decarboxylase [Alphaproteobacteria bacterium]
MNKLHVAADMVPEASASRPQTELQSDYFITQDGVSFAGRHLLLDLWGAKRLDEPDHIEAAMREAVEAAGATLLHIHLHHFSPEGGVSGVAVLAESHISIHTWPERDFAALDVFMCGKCNPHLAVPVFKRAFGASAISVNEVRRGLVP